ncbi:alkyl sulfatase BDS1-like metallo-beta-lactamase superfamily hydrolase [Scopulibacillus darangshiensis]|uniref:Alkyl sulfatase BDS1-like metallo-beta-lactamase superfamily hydrolase n=1 Tax=Scopulibacillus darangshiensis TaxID=442528 RepID=A0A4R2NUG5_9BACL|nr:alkyl sulfatase dimerization domain-containing protein [Scopulibacillus darangshiensis]TCP25620.1 alkyl sulfatase BDS1-like metallo-beta-lactamase superfamily hydrolase [Scopulibacillus darangshiensis]
MTKSDLQQTVDAKKIFSEKPSPSEYLLNHAKRFNKRIEKVTDGVYSAIGYAMGNCILIATEEGNVIVDTTESLQATKEIREEFDKISPKPTVAVIYTHGHTDHVMGTSAFLNGETEVYANQKTKEFFDMQFSQLQDILGLRGRRQFGTRLPEGYVPCAGLGPTLSIDRGKPILVPPTKTFEDSMALKIGGVRFILVHAPGETEDQIFIWLPDKKVLISADNYYPSFPNLYAIRGTAPRPVHQWIRSLDKMRGLGAEYMVPCHSEPIRGSERIDELLTMYRDAIQYVHDAVVRGANQGKTPDELVEEIKLPPHFDDYPEILQLYGQVSWSIRAIYEGYLGWFDGNATNLSSLSPKVRGQKIIDIAGGSNRLLEEGKKAIETGEYQWAAETSDMLLAVSPENTSALELKVEALYKLGESSHSSTGRSYYFTQALELAGELPIRPIPLKVKLANALAMPLETFFENMSIRLDPHASFDKWIAVGFKITDTNETYTVIVRRGIAEVRVGCSEKSDLIVHLQGDLWKEISLGAINPEEAINEGSLKIEGNLELLKEFNSLFNA